MADGELAVLGGSQLRGTDLRLSLPDVAVTDAQLIQLCESEPSAHLFGLSLPESVKTAVIRTLNGGADDGCSLEKEFGDERSQRGMIKKLDALADELKDLPKGFAEFG